MSDFVNRYTSKSRLTGAVLLTVALVLVCAAPSFAGKSSITLVRPDASTSTSTSTGLSMGQQVTFSVSTTATSFPWVDAKCYQNKKLVYEQWNGFFDSWIDGQMFTLGPTASWQSGAADCTAYLVKWDGYKQRVLASTSFHVNG